MDSRVQCLISDKLSVCVDTTGRQMKRESAHSVINSDTFQSS